MQTAPPIVALIVIVIFIIVVLIFIPSAPSKLRATAQLRDVVEIGEVAYFDPEEPSSLQSVGSDPLSGIPRAGDFYARPLFHTKGGIKRMSDPENIDDRAAFMGATSLGSDEAVAIWGNLSSSRKSKYLGLTGYVYDLNVSRPPSRRQSFLNSLTEPPQGVTPETVSSSSDLNRKVVLASLADSVSISEVNGPVCVIMTPNQNLIAPLRRKLLSTPGFPSNSTFKIIPIPSSVYKPTYRYTMLLQVASPEGAAIRSSVKMSRPGSHIAEFTEVEDQKRSQPLTHLDLPTFKTIRYENIAVSHEGFGDVRLKSRGNDQLESSLFSGNNCTPTLIDEASQLLTSQGYQLVNRLDVTPFLGADLGPQGLDNGFQCISKSLNCEGENRDRTVFQTQRTMVAKGDKIAVLAIDHAASRKAIYSTVTFSTDRHLTQITGDTQSIEPVPSLISRLIVYEPDADSEVSVVVTEKVYLEPLSKIGPAVQELIPMTVFVIKPLNL